MDEFEGRGRLRDQEVMLGRLPGDEPSKVSTDETNLSCFPLSASSQSLNRLPGS